MDAEAVDFVDESHDVASAYRGCGVNFTASHDILPLDGSEQSPLLHPSLNSDVNVDHQTRSSPYGPSKRSKYPTPSTLDEEQVHAADREPLYQHDFLESQEHGHPFLSPCPYNERPRRPLQSAKEFYLLQHFIEKLGSWVSVGRTGLSFRILSLRI